MKPQCREQADHTMGHTFSSLTQTMIGSDGAIGQHIKAAPKTLEPARIAQAGKIGAGYAVRLKVSGANNACLLGESQNLHDFGGFHV
ncbi:hypothetical protein UT5_15250 [Ferrigenium sp. UT5]